MKQKKEFMKSKQAGWVRVKIRSTKYLFSREIAGLLETFFCESINLICRLIDHRSRNPTANVDGATSVFEHK